MAASKPTAVHFSLVFFVMTTLILALVCYLTGKQYADEFAKRKEKEDAASALQTALNNEVSNVAALKDRMGYQDQEVVGDQNSVNASLIKDLTNYGREQTQPSPANPTVAGTLAAMRQALNDANAQIAGLQTDLKDAESRLTQETTMHGNRADELKTSADTSEADLQKNLTQKAEELAGKDTEIDKWRDQYRNELVEKERMSDELDRVRKDLTGKIADLENVVDFMRDRVNKLENVSFEKSDGEIVSVNNTTRTVWINLGTQHNLRNQVSFSVYLKDHRGVARGVEDIKAKIEVTKIMGPRLAEARILNEDISRPIQAGDPVYSPLWTAGVKENFSFVGIIDLDGDGVSDRELLHDLIANAGAQIELEVDDKGIRIPENAMLSIDSKFLVVGNIQDPTEFSGFDTKQLEVKKVNEENKALEDEARRKGVKIVRLADFLSYIGYQPANRLYISGETRKNTLKSGSRSTATDEVLGANRQSSGQTSSRFKSNTSK